MLRLDHLAVCATDLDAARAHVETALGLPMQDGGRHALFGTHNALMGLRGGHYLEAIAPDPGAPPPKRPRWFDLDRFSGAPRLSNWVLATEDLDGACARFALDVGRPVEVTRGDLRWRMAVPADGRLPLDGICPALIQWISDRKPPSRLVTQPAALSALTLCHPDIDILRTALAPLLPDRRVTFRHGPPGIRATFDTSGGQRML